MKKWLDVEPRPGHVLGTLFLFRSFKHGCSGLLQKKMKKKGEEGVAKSAEVFNCGIGNLSQSESVRIQL